MEKNLFTSESVSEGHPDKLCDQISDAILDECLRQDKYSRVACECFATTNLLVIGGEITTNAKVDYEAVARDVMRRIGYTAEDLGIDADTCEIKVVMDTQSSDIALGTNVEVGGAGDQGIMFGYATNETETYMPLPISMAHELVRYASELRHNGTFKHARPDMKSQVTIDYTDENNPKVDTILMSIQHDPDFNEEEFKTFIKEKIMKEVVRKHHMNEDYKVFINPTGRFVIGGPHGDTGLTGRKIIVDTYGGMARHGGGAFSGKDPSKVDRSAAYITRYIAKNIVAAGLCDRIEIQLSYAIGIKDPTSVHVDTYGTGKVADEVILDAIKKEFDLTPQGIINTLDLLNPIYGPTAAYGHFGRTDVEFPWEKLNKVEDLKKYLA
ncbi:MAG: methionine adenosyltransferase [Catenibacterium mitsuokai]|jgi:S-adenosylmethionine synthetase|uniref:methionine adenosyltransferase n=1 Tax=Catenibacterium TaxID=135858 RepID=UPI00242C2610|nr:methionine adenosyltransferase [Catenibacterium mitsuokai]MCI6077041.1 methionine adenosyltransferase [Catenibacterium mitsuokai]MDD6594820.1 methionine adenosyltransferase [Catenibacterium mitsuokai]MDY3677305.1 methionine adenosyltransferase [Catenibacterium mitsuokai]